MSVSDRWHKASLRPGEKLCAEHQLPPSAKHLQGARWLVRWRTLDGQQGSKHFERKPGKNPEIHADAFDKQVQGELTAGTFVDPRGGAMPFGEYAATWVDARLLKETSDETYAQRLRVHIVPAFGRVPLLAIRPTMVQKWVKKLAESGLAPRTIGNIYDIFSSIMRGAVRDEKIRKTPCTDIDLPDVAKTAIVVLTGRQVAALAAAVRKIAPRYEILIWIGYGLGVRQGEAFGFSESRILSGDGIARIDRQVIRAAKSRPKLAVPKTSASVRDVPLPEFLAGKLRSHTEAWPPAGDVLCRTARGNLLNRNWFNPDVWRPALAAARTCGKDPAKPSADGECGQTCALEAHCLPQDATFHDLRHTFASEALHRGVAISSVSRWLGHATITETVDTYGHLVEGAAEQMRSVMDEAYQESAGDGGGDPGEGDEQ